MLSVFGKMKQFGLLTHIVKKAQRCASFTHQNLHGKIRRWSKRFRTGGLCSFESATLCFFRTAGPNLTRIDFRLK
jgi:hypothetical protein